MPPIASIAVRHSYHGNGDMNSWMGRLGRQVPARSTSILRCLKIAFFSRAFCSLLSIRYRLR